jgi:two-component system response regulator YesN
MAYVNNHINEDISLAKLADLVYFNPSYLSRLFKQTTGINLLAYINKIRIEKAKKLLQESNMKIHEISSSVGYESASYFTQFFRRNVQMSPQEYRDMFSK